MTNENNATELMESVEVPVYKEGDIVKGTVIELQERRAVVDLDNKFTGYISLSEISSVRYTSISDAIKIGEQVECKVLDVNADKEELKLSKKAIDSDKAWEKLTALQAADEAFAVKIVEANEKGLVADVGIRAFIPAKQVAREFIEDLSVYAGQTLTVKIKDLSTNEENGKRNVILSARVVLDEQANLDKQSFMNHLHVGQELSGTVQRLTNFGAFVNTGAMDGLVHVSELSWEHVNKPEDVVKEGDQVNVKIIALDPEKQKISLSVKALLQKPWEAADGKISEGDVLSGVVKRIAEFGAFVEIAPGVDGLVHISELSHTRVKTAHEVVKVGQQVQVKVLEFDVAKKKAGLSIKALLEKPEDSNEVREADRAEIEANSSKQNLTQNLGEVFGAKLNNIRL
jgi:small subunit ribosomal protein S1